MAEDTGIQWAGDENRMGATWNPWMGCTKVAENRAGMPGSACDFCYAETFAEPKYRKRVRDDLEAAGIEVTDDFSVVPLWGQHGIRQRVVTNWEAPITWDRKAAEGGYRLRVFTASLADVFESHKSIQPEWRAHLFDLVERCRNLDWQVLTKRPGSIQHMIPKGWKAHWPRNCWIGTSVEHHGTVSRIEHLLALPGNPPVRFLSCEPLLSEIDLRPYLGADKINWVIAGGETGTGARPTDLDWVRSLRDQCAAAGVPFFYKQPGTIAGRGQHKVEVPDIDDPEKKRDQWRLDDRHWWEWPVVQDPMKRRRGRPKNTHRGLRAALDSSERQARKRSLRRHDEEAGWEEVIARWLGPLPRDKRKEAAERLRKAITRALKNT